MRDGYRVAADNLTDRWFRAAGFEAGDVVKGVVDVERDAVEPGREAPALRVLFYRRFARDAFDGIARPPTSAWPR